MESKTFEEPSSTDDELYLQNASDEDDESTFSSGSTPKLQFRYVKSKAVWNDEMGMAEVIEKRGKTWVTTGIVRSGKVYSSMEESLYLMEIGALDLLDDCERSICLTDMYEKIASSKGGCCWELFEVYRHLKSLGYIVGRHGVSWSLKGIKSSHNAVDGSEETEQVVGATSKSDLPINKLFSEMQINSLRPDFDVYLPNSRFRKSSPGDPSFLLYLSRGDPPSRAEMEALEKQCGGLPLKIGLVTEGRVSFFSFDKVEIPLLP
ncbi:hypothetical protein PIB30_069880 [Stylosanthes scabra]|uniref:tRNA-splicing endonuclease subunit Sen54 N-terminal domain-containing protein n=1 Tax=Stylosanthes scabra TaxID=79078 RepID=A0ABU6ZM04_9FABA|nr:hypothetical protein [Stylosanthes scabra]